MQIFRRAVGEGILIGDEILVEVVESADGVLSLGVVAPRDVRVSGVEPRPSDDPSGDLDGSVRDRAGLVETGVKPR